MRYFTDGTRSTPDTNNRWPISAKRLTAQPGNAKIAVLDAGIAGNRVLSEGAFNAGLNALARFSATLWTRPARGM